MAAVGRGCELLAKENNELPPSANPKTWQSIIKSPNFGRYLVERNRFKEYRKLIAQIWENKDAKETDP
jgi:hypothetical protein